MLDDEQRRAHVDGDEGVELVLGEDVQIGAATDRGIVDQDVHSGPRGVFADQAAVGGPQFGGVSVGAEPGERAAAVARTAMRSWPRP
ncbi:hypothetical protein ABZ635_25155 [Nocardiopsis sp. NPDC007018]|uniref:hypothetical protein n=1 Tax=Nocardiopsis sp. NPDC007018 TaxID=3155721 RepID=UPI0033E07D61